MSDIYFKVLLWNALPPLDAVLAIESSTGVTVLQKEEIQRLVSFLIMNKEKIGFKGEL